MITAFYEHLLDLSFSILASKISVIFMLIIEFLDLDSLRRFFCRFLAHFLLFLLYLFEISNFRRCFFWNRLHILLMHRLFWASDGWILKYHNRGDKLLLLISIFIILIIIFFLIVFFIVFITLLSVCHYSAILKSLGLLWPIHIHVYGLLQFHLHDLLLLSLGCSQKCFVFV